MTYANSGSCRLVPKTFAVTTDQAIGNSCSQGSTGVVDTKLYGGGVTPLFLTVTAVYDNTKTSNCMAPAIPMQWVATTLSVDDCVPTVGCQYSGPLYTSTVCSNTKTYQQDVAAAFGWNQYVTVESYIAGKGCAQSALARVATYLADGYCHSSSSTKSFIATSGMDGLVRIDFYTSSSSCGFKKSTLTVTAAQAKGNMCISTGFIDIKVFTPY
ncbi:hypothetical protein PI124_g8844 [Phytophthora idaei]|nr:hypothetical protein PI124_g8844 [Phytophthora idaei]